MEVDFIKFSRRLQADKNEVHPLPEKLNEKVANLHLLELDAALNVPTQEHADYSGFKVEGPFKGGHFQY